MLWKRKRCPLVLRCTPSSNTSSRSPPRCRSFQNEIGRPCTEHSLHRMLLNTSTFSLKTSGLRYRVAARLICCGRKNTDQLETATTQGGNIATSSADDCILSKSLPPSNNMTKRGRCILSSGLVCGWSWGPPISTHCSHTAQYFARLSNERL